MKKSILTVLAVASLCLLSACNGFPAGEAMDIGLKTAYTYYETVYCTAHTCSDADKAVAKKAYNLAEQGVSDYQNGKITQQQAEDLINKALALFVQLEG